MPLDAQTDAEEDADAARVADVVRGADVARGADDVDVATGAYVATDADAATVADDADAATAADAATVADDADAATVADNADAATVADMIDEAALLARYARGDAAAARALTARLVPRVHAQAFRMLGDGAEAEDVAQEAMMRLWRIAPDWRSGEARVTTWLYRVVANLCTDRLRKRPRATMALEAVSEPSDPAPSVQAQMQTEARMQALRAALAALPERQRLAVTLRHFDGASNPQIAERLGISTEAVESLTARGKRALAAALKGQVDALGYEDE